MSKLFGGGFFFNDTATTEIYTLSLHDALPICTVSLPDVRQRHEVIEWKRLRNVGSVAPSFTPIDRKSTRLNSSHSQISYAVFCLKKKDKKPRPVASPLISVRPMTILQGCEMLR